MLKKIKITKDNYIFQFCYYSVHNLEPQLVISISNKIISQSMIDSGIFVFEKNGYNIDIDPRYRIKKYKAVDEKILYNIKNYIDNNYSCNNEKRTQYIIKKCGFPILYYISDKLT